MKYKDKEAADHLINILQQIYTIKIDWTGAKYIGFTIQFNRSLKTVTLSMPSYVAKVLERFAPLLQHGAQSPSIYTPPLYGARTQETDEFNAPQLQQPTGTEEYGELTPKYPLIKPYDEENEIRCTTVIEIGRAHV